MSGGAWAAKRFWQSARASACEGGFTVHLDARAVKTPLKTPLVVPTMALAEVIAAEWDVQVGKVDPATMPMTRMANSALDKVVPQFAEVADMIAAYGGSDLLCYRATDPQALIARQAAAWDPVLHWAATALHAPLNITHGVMPVPQPVASLAALSAQVHALTAFELAAFHDLVAITGSLVLGLGILGGQLTLESAWMLSRVDETWQAEIWGSDDQAAAAEAFRRHGLHEAGRFLELCRLQSA